MNLQEYFNQQKELRLSDQQKLDLLSHIKGKRHTKILPILRFSFSYKQISYTFIALAVIILWIGGTLLEKNISIDNFFFSTHNNYWGVYAEHIAEIIEFNGKYTIQRDGQTFSSQFISNGDTIHLKKDAEMLFNLNDGSQAKIIGPADFSIIKNEDQSYKITLHEGSFFKIYNEISNQDIEIITDNVSLFSEKDQKLDFQFIKDGSTLIVKNNGGNLKVVAQENENKSEKIINKEMISINANNINTIQDTETFNRLLAKNNISDTIQIKAPEEKTSLEIDTMIPDLVDIIKDKTLQWTQEIDETIKSNLWIEEKTKIPSKAQNDLLKNKLESFFLSITLDKIAIAILQNNSQKTEEALIELRDKLNTINTAFGRTTFKESSPSTIQEQSLALKKDLENTYYISPSLLSQLEKIANRCEYFQTLKADPSNTQSPSEQRDQIKNTLPNRLKLK